MQRCVYCYHSGRTVLAITRPTVNCKHSLEREIKAIHCVRGRIVNAVRTSSILPTER